MDLWLYLLFTLPLSFAILLRYLSSNDWFLQTQVGEYVFINRDFYGVSHTILTHSNNDPTFQQREALSKNIYGRVLPDFKTGELNFVLDRNVAKQQAMKTRSYPYLTHYEYLCKRYLGEDDSKTKIANDIARFVSEHTWHQILLSDGGKGTGGKEPLHQICERYITTMHDKLFSPAFVSMFCGRSRVYRSVHTFAPDVSLIRQAIESYKLVSRHFIVSYDIHENAWYHEICYTCDRQKSYGKSYSCEAFWDQTCAATNCVCVVQENYARWRNHQQSSKHGKLAYIGFHPFKIIRTTILDEMECWNILENRLNRVKFARINAVCGALESDYFPNLIRSLEVRVWMTPAFYCITTALSIWAWFVIAISGILCFMLFVHMMIVAIILLSPETDMKNAADMITAIDLITALAVSYIILNGPLCIALMM